MKKFLSTCLFLSLANLLKAQENAVEMADGLRSSGKIYVVVLSLALIFAGIGIYLFMLDRRLKTIEKELKKNR